MPPFLSSRSATLDSGDLQAAVDAYLAANPLDLSAHLAAPDPHTGYQLESGRGVANGYASLNGSAVIPDNQIPASIARDTEIATQITAHTNASDPHGDRAVAAAALTTHAADTTSIHGIADTSVLETFTTAASRLATHNSTTTNVHGIPNVNDLLTTSSNKIFPQRLFVTTDQTEPGAAVEGDFWVSPSV